MIITVKWKENISCQFSLYWENCDFTRKSSQVMKIYLLYSLEVKTVSRIILNATLKISGVC